jgi:hypothetical protein
VQNAIVVYSTFDLYSHKIGSHIFTNYTYANFLVQIFEALFSMSYIIGVQNLRALFIMEEMQSVEVVEVWKLWHGSRGHLCFW